MCASGVCQRMISETMFGISDGIVAQLLVLVGVLIERQHAAGDRIARRVVAADDQQNQVAEIFHRRHVLGGFAVGEHRDQIDFAGLVHALVPQAREILEALEQIGLLLFDVE